jgi:hypothetical protein
LQTSEGGWGWGRGQGLGCVDTGCMTLPASEARSRAGVPDSTSRPIRPAARTPQTFNGRCLSPCPLPTPCPAASPASAAAACRPGSPPWGTGAPSQTSWPTARACAGRASAAAAGPSAAPALRRRWWPAPCACWPARCQRRTGAGCPGAGIQLARPRKGARARLGPACTQARGSGRARVQGSRRGSGGDGGMLACRTIPRPHLHTAVPSRDPTAPHHHTTRTATACPQVGYTQPGVDEAGASRRRHPPAQPQSLRAGEPPLPCPPCLPAARRALPLPEQGQPAQPSPGWPAAQDCALLCPVVSCSLLSAVILDPEFHTTPPVPHTPHTPHTQGAGRLDVIKSREVLATYKPRASLVPAHLHFGECPYMWPFCRQAFYAGAMPVMFNATVLNGMGVVGGS